MNGLLMNPSRRTPPQRINDQQHGFSMVELMIAITISLLLLAGVIQIFLASRQTYTMQDGMSRLQENARYALGRITQDIARSGYLGCSDSAEIVVQNHLTDQSGGYDFSTAVTGEDNTGVDGTDTLTVRYGSSGAISLTGLLNDAKTGEDVAPLDSANANYSNLDQYDVLTVSDCEQASIFMITNDPDSSGGTIEHDTGIVAPSGPNQGQSNADAEVGGTFITQGKGSSQANAFKTSRATYLVDASSSGTGNSLYVNSVDPDNELIEGVEDFQVQFGVNNDSDLGADRYVDADDVGAANWNNVVSVRLSLALNTVGPVQGGATIAKDFTTTVRLRNRGETISN